MLIKDRIRTIPDHPKPGVQFRDITTLLKDPEGLEITIDKLVEQYRGVHIDKVVGVEARGFIVGGALAHRIRAGFVPVRKKGKLPWETVSMTYTLEYGTDEMEMHRDAVKPGEQVILVDDLVATGGTAEAAVKLLRGFDADVVAAVFVIDLPDLGGSKLIEDMGVPVRTLVSFEGH